MSGVQISMAALDALQRGIAEMPEATRRELLAAATEATMLIEREVKEGIPRGATGLTAASITSDAYSTPAGVLGVVGSSQPAALFLELGTKPHMPPASALVPWVRAVLGVDAKRAPSVAYLVARKIARKGTQAQKPFAHAVERTQSQVVAMFEAAAGRVAARLAGGAA